MVDTDATGEMDYADFSRKLAENKGKPAIVSMNAGTTVTGAVDNLSRVKTALYENGKPLCHAAHISLHCVLPYLSLPLLRVMLCTSFCIVCC